MGLQALVLTPSVTATWGMSPRLRLPLPGSGTGTESWAHEEAPQCGAHGLLRGQTGRARGPRPCRTTGLSRGLLSAVCPAGTYPILAPSSHLQTQRCQEPQWPSLALNGRQAEAWGHHPGLLTAPTRAMLPSHESAASSQTGGPAGFSHPAWVSRPRCASPMGLPAQLFPQKGLCSLIKGDVWARVDSGPPHTSLSPQAQGPQNNAKAPFEATCRLSQGQQMGLVPPGSTGTSSPRLAEAPLPTSRAGPRAAGLPAWCGVP